MPIRDIRMIQKSLEQRWPIRPEYREALVKKLVRVIADPQSSAREVTAASRALIAAEAQNQSDECNAETDAGRNRFLEIAERLGLGSSLANLAEQRTIDGIAITDPSRDEG